MDAYQHWRDALAGKPVNLHDGAPQPGFYKLRQGKGGPYLPVAIWPKDGQLVARVADEMRDPEQIWTWCADKPVSKEDAKAAFETGKWPGDAPTIGDNSRHYGEGFEGIEAEIADYMELCQQFVADAKKAGGIKTKAEADKASNMADAIGKVRGGLAKKADEMRDAEVRPHLEAQREINARYKPLIESGENMARTLRDLSTVWTRAEQKRLQDIADAEAAKRRAEAEAKAKAERAAWEAEQRKLAAKAKKAGEQLDLEAALPPPPPPAPEIVAETVKVQVGGQRGARRSLRKERVAKIVDYAKALAFFAESDDVRALVQQLAQRAVKAKLAVPGVEVVEEERL